MTRGIVRSTRAFRLVASSSVAQALSVAEAAFASAGVPDARLSAQHLLAQATGLGSDRARLAAQRDAPVDDAARCAFERMCARRLEREPVQYILGEWDFHELTLRLQPPVLIPRPETEELVERVVEFARSATDASRDDTLRVLDVGTGSGAIGLAVAHQLPRASVVGIDVSDTATALARANAERLQLDARFSALHVPDGVSAYAPTGRFDVIVSNPPYIPARSMGALQAEVRRYEDVRALCGGEDGADVVREVVRAAPRLLDPRGPRSVWLEVDASHPPLLEAWLSGDSTGETSAAPPAGMRFSRAFRDADGRPRFCQLEWDSGPGRPRTS